MNDYKTKVLNDIKDIITAADPFANGVSDGRAMVDDLLWLVDHSRSLSTDDFKSVCDSVKTMYSKV